MTKKRQIVVRWMWLLNSGLVLALPGCQPSSELSTFLEDFARQALAAFLL